MRQVYGRPVTLAVAPVTATTPSYPGQLALQLGGFHVRAYHGEAAFPPPGARLPIAGTAAHQGKALVVEVEFVREVGVFGIVSRYPCDPTGPRAEKRRMQGLPVPRGGFHKAGEGPAFGDSFPDFSSLRNRAQRSVPAWLASLCQGEKGRQSPAKGRGGGEVCNQQLPHLGIFVVHLHYDKTSNFMEPA